jgi:hypothetical protein
MKEALMKQNEEKSGTEGRVLARVVSEEALKSVGGGMQQGYWTSVITDCGCDITNAAGDDDGWAD